MGNFSKLMLKIKVLRIFVFELTFFESNAILYESLEAVNKSQKALGS